MKLFKVCKLLEKCKIFGLISLKNQNPVKSRTALMQITVRLNSPIIIKTTRKRLLQHKEQHKWPT